MHCIDLPVNTRHHQPSPLHKLSLSNKNCNCVSPLATWSYTIDQCYSRFLFHFLLSYIQGRSQRGLEPPVRSPQTLEHFTWNDTLYRGLWRATILSFGQSTQGALTASWKKISLNPCCLCNVNCHKIKMGLNFNHW